MLKFLSHITKESVIDIVGVVCKPEVEVKSCTVKAIELSLKKVFVVSRSLPVLPLQIVDAARRLEKDEDEGLGDEEADKDKEEEEKKDEQKLLTVKQSTRLNNRILDLRTPSKQAIFKL